MLSSKQILIIAVIAVGVFAAYFLAWKLLAVLAVGFAAILVATLIRTGGLAIRQITPMRRKLSMGLFLIVLLAASVTGVYFAAGPVKRQADTLAETLPQSVNQVLQDLNGTPIGGFVADDFRSLLGLDQAPRGATADATERGGDGDDAGEDAATQSASQPATRATTQPEDQFTLDIRKGLQRAFGAVSGVFGAIVSALLVLVTGIYLAMDPALYVNGTARLFPADRREQVRDTLHEMGRTLQWWLIGQLASMTVVGVLSFIALKILGVELAVVIALLTFFLVFIPNFGPIISLALPVLIALTQEGGGLSLALWVIGAYVLIQILESYLITPLIQKRAVSLPPALLIMTQLLMGTLLGALGIAIAAPLAAVAITAVRKLHWHEPGQAE